MNKIVTDQEWETAQEHYRDYVASSVCSEFYADEIIEFLTKGFDVVCSAMNGKAIDPVACFCINDAANKYLDGLFQMDYVLIPADHTNSIIWKMK